MHTKTLLGACALSIVLGLGLAYCQHQGQTEEDPTPTCDGVTYYLPAGFTVATKSSSTRKTTSPSAPRADPKQPTPIGSPTLGRTDNDLDFELDGC